MRRVVGLLVCALVVVTSPSAFAKKDHGKPKQDTSEVQLEGVHRVRGGPHLEVKARDLRLRDVDEQKLRHIAERYHQATRKRLVVTGGTRTPERQAQLMVEKLRHGDDIVALYENKAAVNEIKGAYDDGVAKGQPRKATIKAIALMIRAQMARGVFVSKHLQAGAVDVRSWGMNADLESALRSAVKEEAGVSIIDERRGPEPHFHLSLGAAGATSTPATPATPATPVTHDAPDAPGDPAPAPGEPAAS